jgi:hypothetical protein
MAREAMVEVRRRTRHAKPINAHAEDPEGFDRALDDLIAAIKHTSAHEHDDLILLVNRLDPEMSDDLHRRVERAVGHASLHPNLPHNPIARRIASVVERIDRAVNDDSTTSHTALDQLGKRAAKAGGKGHR